MKMALKIVGALILLAGSVGVMGNAEYFFFHERYSCKEANKQYERLANLPKENKVKKDAAETLERCNQREWDVKLYLIVFGAVTLLGLGIMIAGYYGKEEAMP